MQVRYSNWCMRISKLRCSEMHAVSNGKDVDAAALVGFHSVKQIAVSLTATLGILIGCVAISRLFVNIPFVTRHGCSAYSLMLSQYKLLTLASCLFLE